MKDYNSSEIKHSKVVASITLKVEEGIAPGGKIAYRVKTDSTNISKIVANPQIMLSVLEALTKIKHDISDESSKLLANFLIGNISIGEPENNNEVLEQLKLLRQEYGDTDTEYLFEGLKATCEMAEKDMCVITKCNGKCTECSDKPSINRVLELIKTGMIGKYLDISKEEIESIEKIEDERERTIEFERLLATKGAFN